MIDETAITQAADYLWRKLQHGESGVSRDMIATEIKGVLLPYLRTTEPVSVSLEKLRLAYRNAKPQEIIDGEEIDGTEYSRRKMAMALDAAGVKYVD